MLTTTYKNKNTLSNIPINIYINMPVKPLFFNFSLNFILFKISFLPYLVSENTVKLIINNIV